MNLETENRIAAILLKEAAELRRQADREGVHAYLQKPTVRGRPNSRFLSATVLGVQQANRVVEVNEMWRVRQKEIELNDRLKGRSKDVSNGSRGIDNCARSTSKRYDDNASSSYTSSKRTMEGCNSREDEGLGDEQIEEFLNSRTKRGRGSVGSRMDETGPYLSDSSRKLSPTPSARERRATLGPERPPSMKNRESSLDEEPIEKLSSKKSRKSYSSSSSSDDDDEDYREHRHKRKKVYTSSDKKSSSKHKLSKRSRDKKKKRKEGRRK